MGPPSCTREEFRVKWEEHPISIYLADGLPQANVFLVFGLNRPKTPLPLPGTTNCNLYTSLDIVGVTQLSAAGTFNMLVKIPNQTNLNCGKIYFQAFPVDKQANAFQASATNYARILVGL